MGPWVKSGGCGADGKQWYQRTVINSSEPRTKSESCCYISPWSGWGGWGACNGSKRYRSRTRTVVNCPSGTPTSETGSQKCNHCQGKWVHTSYSYGDCRCVKRGYGRMSYKCSKKGKSRTENTKYVITKHATNGGNACPHKSGKTKTGGSYTTVDC